MWKWTEAKRTAAKLIALGLSERAAARIVRANRRSVARWTRREEFRAEVERHHLGYAIRQGLFQQIAEAGFQREEAASAVNDMIDRDSVGAINTDFVKAARSYRAVANRERSLEDAALGRRKG